MDSTDRKVKQLIGVGVARAYGLPGYLRDHAHGPCTCVDGDKCTDRECECEACHAS